VQSELVRGKKKKKGGKESSFTIASLGGEGGGIVGYDYPFWAVQQKGGSHVREPFITKGERGEKEAFIGSEGKRRKFPPTTGIKRRGVKGKGGENVFLINSRG